MNILVGILAASSILALNACKSGNLDISKEEAVSQEDSNSEDKIQTIVGKEFEITIEGNSAESVEWKLNDYGDSYLKFLKDKKVKNGAKRNVVFSFKALKAGTSLVQLARESPRNPRNDSSNIRNIVVRIIRDPSNKSPNDSGNNGAYFSITKRGDHLESPLAAVSITAQEKLNDSYANDLVGANTSNVYKWHNKEALESAWAKLFGLYFCESGFRLQEGGLRKGDTSNHLFLDDELKCRQATAAEESEYSKRFRRPSGHN